MSILAPIRVGRSSDNNIRIGAEVRETCDPHRRRGHLMGRDKRNENRAEHFAAMVRSMMMTPAWRALSATGQALYPWLKLEWRGPKANNNGKIKLSVRQAAEALGVQPNTAAAAFHDLQAKGFIVVTEQASLGISGAANSAAYELTEIALPHGQDHSGRRLYKDWAPGHDFPVHKARANNPKGRGGKTKSHLKNEDRTVVKFETKPRRPSQK